MILCGIVCTSSNFLEEFLTESHIFLGKIVKSGQVRLGQIRLVYPLPL
jgi:hypothetical protein